MSAFMKGVGNTIFNKVSADMKNPQLAEGAEVHCTVNLRLAGNVNVATGAVTYLQGSGYEMDKDETFSYTIGGEENPQKAKEIKDMVMNGWNKILQKYTAMARQNKLSQFAFEYSGSAGV
jgi:phage tail sheath gpL-like